MTYIRGTKKALEYFRARRDCLWLKDKNSLHGKNVIELNLEEEVRFIYVKMWRHYVQWKKKYMSKFRENITTWLYRNEKKNNPDIKLDSKFKLACGKFWMSGGWPFNGYWGVILTNCFFFFLIRTLSS